MMFQNNTANKNTIKYQVDAFLNFALPKNVGVRNSLAKSKLGALDFKVGYSNTPHRICRAAIILGNDYLDSMYSANNTNRLLLRVLIQLFLVYSVT